MNLGIAGKHALVLGASEGLGFAVAQALLAEGCRVAICSRSLERIQRAAAALGDGVTGFVCDLRDSNSRVRLAGDVQENGGPIDILVVNSGGPPPGLFEEHSNAVWRESMDEHLGATIDLVRAIAPEMKRRNWGRILSVTSCYAKEPGDGMIISNTVRAAVSALNRTLANEFAAHGITVNNLLPGFTATKRLESLSRTLACRDGEEPFDILGRWSSQVPMRRVGTPQEFAAVAAFLCSKQAAYVTGVSLSVDGGWHRSLF